MFVHLHIHSHYSFLDSTLSVEEIVAAASRAGMDAVALTDTNGLYAAVPFIKACRAAGVRPIIGAEIVWNGGGMREVGGERLLEEGRGKRSEARNGNGGGRQEAGGENVSPTSTSWPLTNVRGSAKLPLTSNFRAVVLARGRRGYAELSRLVTQRRLAAPLPFDPSEFDESKATAPLYSTILNPQSEIRNPKSEICFSPGPQFEKSLLDALLGLSEEHVWILTDSPALLRLLAGRGNVFGELILTARRRGLCRRLYDLAAELHVPVVATGDVHFLRRDDYPLYRLLRAVGAQKTIETLDDAEVGDGRFEAGENALSSVPQSAIRNPQSAISSPLAAYFCFVDEEHYFKTAAEMAQTFRGLRAALRNTRYIAERCDADWAGHTPPLLGGWKFPRVALPRGETAFSHLWKVTFEGLKQRYRPLTPEATRRLEYELEVIARLGFAEYFLAVNEIAEAARRRGFRFLGRGSAANSIVSFALGLTPVDPIRHNLYFERFLNPERRSPPDIDLDFSWKERDAVVRWIFDHFGHDRVALIATHITLQPRQAIREVGKAMGLTEGEVNRFTRPIPGWLGEGFGGIGFQPVQKRLAELPDVFPECRHLPIGEEPWKTILAHAERILNFPRHLSIHCGGLLITPEPITDFTPLQRAAKGPIITQMEMHAIEDLGLIKIDILSNRSLGVLADCLRMLEVVA
jgi:DNA polymerase III alpha subunit